jgi:hypothetical protein
MQGGIVVLGHPTTVLQPVMENKTHPSDLLFPSSLINFDLDNTHFDSCLP